MLQKAFKKHIDRECLLNNDERLLLAVSGGGDSMAMLDLVINEGYYCEVAHVNFRLRKEAGSDAALVRRMCREKGLIFHLKEKDTHAYAKEKKLSIEMAAREIRYNFFEEIMTAHNLDKVLVAHHANDVVETFFINLVRGTGLRGLHGILPQKGRIVRPLLPFTHQDLLTHLEERGLAYNTDKTNFDTDIPRNKLRHEIIPHLEALKPGFNQIMQGTIGRLREAENIVNAYVESWKAQHLKEWAGAVFLPKKSLYSATSPSELLYHLLHPLGFSSAVIDRLASPSEQRVGAVFYAKEHRLLIDREHLIISPLNQKTEEYWLERSVEKTEQPFVMHLSFFEKDKHFNLIKDAQIAYLDAERLRFPLQLRHWKEGDAFCPIGMGGRRKKVSDFFIDQKFSALEKEQTWLLCSGEDIVWLVGHRLDERYKIRPTSKSVLKISL